MIMCYNFLWVCVHDVVNLYSSCAWCRDYKYATVYDASKIPPVGVGSI